MSKVEKYIKTNSNADDEKMQLQQINEKDVVEQSSQQISEDEIKSQTTQQINEEEITETSSQQIDVEETTEQETSLKKVDETLSSDNTEKTVEIPLAIKAFAEKLNLEDKEIINVVMEKLNIVENANGYVDIPYYDENNNLIDIKQFSDEQNFKWEKCISPSVFGLNWFKKYNKDYIVITSDESTCVALIANNIQSISICGDDISHEIANEIANFSKVYVLIDDDEQSKKLYSRVFDNIIINDGYIFYSKTYGYDSFAQIIKNEKQKILDIFKPLRPANLFLVEKQADHVLIRRYFAIKFRTKIL